MIGQTLNSRYTVTARIGKGAMGTVYRGIDKQSGQEVAIKAIARDLAFDVEMLERFKREGEALRQLRHPNIVGFVDAFHQDDQYVIVMEYVAGGSLHDLIKKGSLPVQRARQVALDLCDALIRAHRLDIIHRDIKPENVLITGDGTPKLTDFGVARLTSEGTRLTGTGTQIGTPYYMSPEAWEGKPLDAQADIWSLGVMLFEMVSGQVPFDGDTAVAVMHKVLTAPPPDPRQLSPDVTKGLAQIIERALQRDKTTRYQTMREVSLDLERGEPIAAMKTAPIPAAAPVGIPTKPIQPARSSWQWTVVGIAIGAMAVVAFLLWAIRALFMSGESTSLALVTATSIPITMQQPATTGTISGEVIISGTEWKGHKFYVSVMRWGEQTPAYSTTLNAPGQYRLTNVAPGEYTLSVTLDMDDSGYGPPTSGDVIVMYGAEGKQTQFTMKAGQELTGMNMTLVAISKQATLVAVGNVACTPVPGVGAGSISGMVSPGKITPLPAGAIYVSLSLPDGAPTPYTIKLEKMGPYKLGDVKDGTYIVSVMLDTDGSGPTGSTADDLVGFFGGGYNSIKTVTISGGCAITGIDIAFEGRPPERKSVPTPTPTTRATTPPTTSGPTTSGGTISGTVTIGQQCSDGQSHKIFVEAARSDKPPGPPDYIITLDAPNAYTLRGIAKGSYYLNAIMDCDNSGPGPFTSGDITGRVGMITIATGNEVLNVNFTLELRTP